MNIFPVLLPADCVPPSLVLLPLALLAEIELLMRLVLTIVLVLPLQSAPNLVCLSLNIFTLARFLFLVLLFPPLSVVLEDTSFRRYPTSNVGLCVRYNLKPYTSVAN